MTHNQYPDFILPKTKIVGINVSGHHFKIEMVENLDKYLDEVADIANQNEDFIPYWSEFWPSSLALSEYIVENIQRLEGKKIIELGCGIGLIATLLASQGIFEIATDHHPLALKLTRKNVLRNAGKDITTKIFDWRYPDIEEKFDIILASDVIYESRMIKPLVNVFNTLLAPEGEVILAEPNRSVAKTFFIVLRERGYILNSEERTVQLDKRQVRISIYSIK